MLERMQEIYNKPSIVNRALSSGSNIINGQTTPTTLNPNHLNKTLNLVNRKKEVLRIDQENKRLVNKLQCIKPLVPLPFYKKNSILDTSTSINDNSTSNILPRRVSKRNQNHNQIENKQQISDNLSISLHNFSSLNRTWRHPNNESLDKNDIQEFSERDFSILNSNKQSFKLNLKSMLRPQTQMNAESDINKSSRNLISSSKLRPLLQKTQMSDQKLNRQQSLQNEGQDALQSETTQNNINRGRFDRRQTMNINTERKFSILPSSIQNQSPSATSKFSQKNTPSQQLPQMQTYNQISPQESSSAQEMSPERLQQLMQEAKQGSKQARLILNDYKAQQYFQKMKNQFKNYKNQAQKVRIEQLRDNFIESGLLKYEMPEIEVQQQNQQNLHQNQLNGGINIKQSVSTRNFKQPRQSKSMNKIGSGNHPKPNKFIDINQFNLIVQNDKTHKKKKKSKSKRQSASSQQQIDQTTPNNQEQYLNDIKAKLERQEQKILKKLMKIQLKKETHEKISMQQSQNLGSSISPRKYDKFVKYDQLKHIQSDSNEKQTIGDHESVNQQSLGISFFKNKLPPRPPSINDYRPIMNITSRGRNQENNGNLDQQRMQYKIREQKFENDLKDNQFPQINNAKQYRSKTPRDM
eukprot:403350838